MSKILIIPDVHGRTFWQYAKEYIDKYDKVIFLGDYLDPYPHEEISFTDSVLNFGDIIRFKSENKEKVVLLLGNHDMHYVDTDFMDCSRLNYIRRSEMNELYSMFHDYFQLIHIYEGCLFSHAGVYEDWLKEYNLTIGDLQWAGFLDEHQCSLEAISSLRGGWNSVGSCVWADIRESLNHKLIDGYYQIVGHTQLSENPYITDKIACLDVRKCFELDTDTKKIIPININSENNENTNNK